MIPALCPKPNAATWRPMVRQPQRFFTLLLAILSSAWQTVGADEWPQWRGPTRDGVWRETGLVEKFSAERLKPCWTAPISPGYCGPTIAKGRVYLTDRQTEPAEIERVLCFDCRDGKPLWTYSYPCPYRKVGYTAGPRASVSIDENRAYSLGTMGHFYCLDAEKGTILWKKDLVAEYNCRVLTWGVSAAPLVDGPLVIVQVGGTDGTCLVAFDKTAGDERWRALDDRPSYSAPIIIEQAGRRVLVSWTGDHVAGLDPATGKLYWQYTFRPARMVINVPTPIVEGDCLFVSAFYDGAAMLSLDREKCEIKELWRRRGKSERQTDALHCMTGTPVMIGDYVYGVDSYGELRCLDARTGDRLWEDRTAVPGARWATIHIVRNGDRFWMFNERGELMITKLSPEGFKEISRTKILDPTTEQLDQRGGVCWSHPGFAYKHVFARNDHELVCINLSAEGDPLHNSASPNKGSN